MKLIDEPAAELAKEQYGGRKASIKSEAKVKVNLMNGLSQMMPLLRKPLLSKCLLVLTIQFCALLGFVDLEHILML